MSNHFIPIDRDQPFVIPVQDWLAPDHLARFIVGIVDGLDVSALERADHGGGSAPSPPNRMLALLLRGCRGRHLLGADRRVVFPAEIQ